MEPRMQRVRREAARVTRRNPGRGGGTPKGQNERQQHPQRGHGPRSAEADPRLYPIERLVPRVDDLTGGERDAVLADRARLRASRSGLVVRKTRDAAIDHQALPKSALARAGKYMLKLWTGLTRGRD